MFTNQCNNDDSEYLYYFHKHTIKYKNVLIAIKEFNHHFKHNIIDRYDLYEFEYYRVDSEDELYQLECEDRYLYTDTDQYYENENKLYGFTDDWESYWSSIYD